MSSPISSLKKSTKSPLPKLTTASSLHGYDSRNILSLKPMYSDGENKLLDEITTNMASSRLKSFKVDPIHGGLPTGGGLPVTRSDTHETTRKHTPSSSVKPSAPSNHELMSIMMSRVSQLEQKVQYQTKEICEKDKKLRVLEDKLKILQSSKVDDDSFSKTVELEKKCLLLQQQVYEMEHFLSDYGMVWVGEEAQARSKTYHRRLSDGTSVGSTDTDPSDHSVTDGQASWKPASSSKAEFKVDYNLILRNINELNILAGEGTSQVQHTTDGARLKVADSIPLALYANGIALYSGPFRSFSDVETQQFVQDLMDGYFPTELQGRSPDGIPLQVSDKRDVFFRDPRHAKAFTGAGQLLGGEIGPSRLVPTNLPKEMIGTFQSQIPNDQPSDPPSSLWSNNDHNKLKEETQLSGHKLSVEQFLNKLPKCVVRQGRVIDIRSSLEQTIQNGDSDANINHGVDVLDTEVVQELKNRLEVDEEERPPTPRDITTLRIRSDTGTKTFVVKMKFDDTIADLRRHIDKKRSRSALPYQIVSPFPRQIFKDKSATLRDCGLTPNAALLLRVRKA